MSSKPWQFIVSTPIGPLQVTVKNRRQISIQSPELGYIGSEMTYDYLTIRDTRYYVYVEWRRIGEEWKPDVDASLHYFRLPKAKTYSAQILADMASAIMAIKESVFLATDLAYFQRRAGDIAEDLRKAVRRVATLKDELTQVEMEVSATELSLQEALRHELHSSAE